MLVPSPAFRSMSLGIMLSVVFVLAATMTLLPAVLAKLSSKVDRLALKWAHSSEHRSARFAAWGERLWRRPLPYALLALVVLVGLAVPVFSLQTGMPSIKVVPSSDQSRHGYTQVQQAFGPGATGPLQLVTNRSQAARVVAIAKADSGITQVMAPQAGADGRTLVQAVTKFDPSSTQMSQTIDRLRAQLPSGTLVGGAVAENHDLQALLSAKTPLVIGVVLALGFLLLLVALQAPLLAAVGVLTNLLASRAAFGVAKLVFQNGDLHSLLGFQPQGFLDAWGPVFFFAMIFAISMDYTVLLLSSAKEYWDHAGDAREARDGALRPSDLRRGRGDGRRVLHLRALRSAAAQGNGRDPRGSGAARPRAARPSAAAAARQMGVVAAQAASPPSARGAFRSRVMLLKRPKTLTPRLRPPACWTGASFSSSTSRAAGARRIAYPGAVHIPLGQIPASLGKLDPTHRYAFACRSAKRSAATRIAAKAGLDAANVRGGVTAWRATSLPLTTTGKDNR